MELPIQESTFWLSIFNGHPYYGDVELITFMLSEEVRFIYG